MTSFSRFAKVIPDIFLDKPLEYGIPSSLADQVKRGVKVEIPLKGKKRYGIVLAVSEEREFSRTLPISRVLSEDAIITEDLFELALWMAKYYAAPLSQVLKIMIPSSVRKETKPKKQQAVFLTKTTKELQAHLETIKEKFPAQAAVCGLLLQHPPGIFLSELLKKANVSKSAVDSLAKKKFLAVDTVHVDRSPLAHAEYFRAAAKQLNAEQEECLKQISRNIDQETFAAFLLHGVTGSGKTEIYIRAIEKTLERGKAAILLVPEISLTGQTIERFKSRFDQPLAVLHHRLSHGERFDEWNNIAKGKANIIIGARSAVFSPVQNLGLIIVDEEHENSYKQSEESPCYHARDIAVFRGSLTDATIILGSATPSLESYHNCKSGKYTLLTLKKRAAAFCPPKIVIVDMKREFEKAKGYTNFSDALLQGIKARCEKGEQTILFLNRRGYHTTFFCTHCRESITCNHCDMALTYHAKEACLKCHLCGFAIIPAPTLCPACRKEEPMKYRGVGTELLESSLHAVFPGIRSIRIDADTTTGKGSHQSHLRDFARGKADVLIGTQMIAKGLHFPEVTLVGVINCDAGFNIPDYKASETSFQLITQVAGRSGRGSLPGEVILQTCMPENDTIRHASQQDYENFYQKEMATRSLFGYPPFSSLVKVAFSGEEEKRVFQTADAVRLRIQQTLDPSYTTSPVFPAGHAKVKDKFRFQLLIKGKNVYPINQALKRIFTDISLPRSIKVLIDVNPVSTFF